MNGTSVLDCARLTIVALPFEVKPVFERLPQLLTHRVVTPDGSQSLNFNFARPHHIHRHIHRFFFSHFSLLVCGWELVEIQFALT